jgi:hypothetical protein
MNKPSDIPDENWGTSAEVIISQPIGIWVCSSNKPNRGGLSRSCQFHGNGIGAPKFGPPKLTIAITSCSESYK